MQTLAILGAGTMGHGIAQVAAMAGLQTRLTDIDAGTLERAVAHVGRNLDKGVARGKVDPEVAAAARANLTTTTDLAAAVEGADLVVEAVPEKLDLKRSLLRAAEDLAPPTAILASNTSSLSIDRIAEALARPERFLGMHFFNPVHIMKLLELIRGPRTDADVLATARAFGERIGKQVIEVADAPGFATSRLGVCLGMEAIRMVEQGVASPEDIDTAMVLGYRHPIGPLKLTDLVGLDVRMAIGSYLATELGNPAFEPPALMRRMVEEGKLGKKTGQGFYTWEQA
jgi:3-hydroxybutyryl-CoA dehydrogenase